MKNKIAAWVAIVFGGVICLFFGLALLGFLATPERWEHLGSGLLTALLLACGVLLIRWGVRGLRRPLRLAGAPSPATPERESQKPVICPNCGARDVPDADGCCSYCGGLL